MMESELRNMMYQNTVFWQEVTMFDHAISLCKICIISVYAYFSQLCCRIYRFSGISTTPSPAAVELESFVSATTHSSVIHSEAGSLDVYSIPQKSILSWSHWEGFTQTTGMVCKLGSMTNKVVKPTPRTMPAQRLRIEPR